jgi:O-antigen/teichoic acid export membrane protein
MFTIITDLGFGTAHIKLVSEGRDEATCNKTYATIKLSLIGVFVFVFLTVFFIQKYGFHKNFESPAHEKVIFLYLIIITITQSFYVITATWTAKMEQAKQDIPSFIQTILYQLLRIILAVLGYKAIGLVVGNLASVLIIVPLYLYLGRDLRFGKFDKLLFKDYLRIATPTILTTVSMTLLYYTDKVILQYYTNSTELGFYSAAFVLGSFIKTIEGSAGMLLFPYFSRHIAENNYELINSSLRKYERFTFSFILPMVLTIAIFSDLIIMMTYGSKFQGAVPIFSIILISFICSLAYLPYGNILYGMGFYKLEAKIWIISLFAFWVFSFLFVSPLVLNLKGLGISIALVLTNLFIFIRMIMLTKKCSKQITLLPGRKILIFNTLFFATAAYLFYTFPISSYYLKGLFVVVIYLLFLASASLFKIIRKEDYSMILELVNVNKMKTYIGSEIFKSKRKQK